MDTTCRAPGCDATRLCRAHIVPAGFGRTLSEPGGHNRVVRPTGSKPAKQPLGEFDNDILCARCDARLGILDEYMIRLCAELPQTGTGRIGEVFRYSPFDGSRFALAVLAILWRASISARAHFQGVRLGPYEDRASAVLLSGRPLSELPEYEVVLLRYASSEHDARRFVFLQQRIRSDVLNVFTMGLGGFQVYAKVDQRPLDRIIAPFAIKAADELRAPITPLETTAEFMFLLKAASGDRSRKRSTEV